MQDGEMVVAKPFVVMAKSPVQHALRLLLLFGKRQVFRPREAKPHEFRAAGKAHLPSH